MSITTSLTTSIGQVRFEIGDAIESQGVKPGGGNFTDEEITYMLTNEDDSVYGAAAAACEILARLWTKITDISVGPRREALSQVSDKWKAQARELRARLDTGGGTVGIVSVEFSDDPYKSILYQDYNSYL